MNKLLNKSLKSFTIYALIVLATSVPAYYFLVDGIWLKELDEHNEIIADRTEIELNNLNLNEDDLNRSIKLWNKIQPGTNLEKTSLDVSRSDSTYTVLRTYVNVEPNRTDRFRGLSRVIEINGKKFLLTVETNVEETEETAMAIAILTFFFFLILVLGFLMLSRRLSLKLWQPFRKTLAELKSFNLNSQNVVSLEKSNIVEFEELNLALKKLFEHTISVYKSQKEFTENASHELQTPLAIIKNKLDLLLQKETLTDRQYQIIEEINNALTRVSRINSNLLLLAKIDNHQFDHDESINMSNVTEDALNQLKEHYANKEISIHTAIEKGCFVNGNRALVEILIQNLLLNSIRYTPKYGLVQIHLRPMALLISNSGLSRLPREEIFKRFVKTSKESSGSGLGLSIVDQICKRHGWTVEYDFFRETHTFKINFERIQN